MNKEMSLSEMLNVVDREINQKLDWIIFGIIAQSNGPLIIESKEEESLHIGDISTMCSLKPLGFYKTNWEELKLIAPKMFNVEMLLLKGYNPDKNFEAAINKARKEKEDWVNFHLNFRCDISIAIEDNFISSITGIDKNLIKNLTSVFPLWAVRID